MSPTNAPRTDGPMSTFEIPPATPTSSIPGPHLDVSGLFPSDLQPNHLFKRTFWADSEIPAPTRRTASPALMHDPRYIPRKPVGDAEPLATSSLPVNYRLAPGPSEAEISVRSMEPFASIADAPQLAGHLRIAGRQIHFRPEGVFRPHKEIPPGVLYVTMIHLDDPVCRPLDPRFPSLRDDELMHFRNALPFAVGIRIFQYGEVEVLCNGKPEVVLPKGAWPLTIGGLDYFVTQAVPARTVPSAASHLIPYEAKVSSGAYRRGACLGVKIVGPDGESAVTAVTHGFVSHHSQNLSQKLVDAFLALAWLLHQSILYFVSKRFDGLFSTHFPPNTDLPITSASQWASKMQVPLLGSEVLTPCADDARRRADIGVVSDIFDFPLVSKPYPAGYVHDLCLIRGSDLPEIISTPVLPRLTRFVPYARQSHLHGEVPLTMDITSRECLLVGAQIIFGDEGDQIRNLSHAILWRSKASKHIKRTKASPHDVAAKSISQGDDLSATGYSGSVLCVGSDVASSTTPVPATAEVLCFQNFETADSGLPPSLLTYQGGFCLPDYVYASTIFMPEGIQTSTKNGDNG
ncbi:hypothetical protein B0H17DRAFT_1205806 [Mycena rosella]|uniref:Uncharacterized protein n=1 Tax=Mycena rosella TaxID=1033263 RepID=A0AAD7D7Z7_MYCRO|nr:hypothetical protein B0H17DRAFT_1205806 [Mycena rosella]